MDRPHRFFRTLTEAFGWRYIAAILLVYGANQGAGESFLEASTSYLLIDTLQLEAGHAETVRGFARIPWQLKSLFGLISDTLPVNGYHRSPYMIIAATLGMVGNLSLTVLPASAPAALAGILLLLTNINFAMPDVMIDATVAQRAQAMPERTADMQALCWGSLFFTAIPAYLMAGALLAAVGPQALFGCATLTAACVGVPAALGWLGEKRRVGRPGIRGCCETTAQVCATVTGSDQKRRVVVSAGVVGAFSISLGVVQLQLGRNLPLVVTLYTVLGATTVVFTLYGLLRGVDEVLARAAVFVFLKNALCPRSRALLFDWSHAPAADADGGGDWKCLDAIQCAAFAARATGPETANWSSWNDTDWMLQTNETSMPMHGNATLNASVADMVNVGGKIFRAVNGSAYGSSCGWAAAQTFPCLSPVLLSWVKVTGYAAGLAGTILYTTHLQGWPFRMIIGMAQAALIVANLVDLMWVMRVNLLVGIPDAAFAFGEEAFIDVLDQIQSQAFFIFAAKLCPREVEASMFALFMGLSNFGYDVGRYSGAGLIAALGIRRPDYDHIDTFMLIKSLCRILPILTVPFLVPVGTPADTAAAMGAGQALVATSEVHDYAAEISMAADSRRRGDQMMPPPCHPDASSHANKV